MYGDSYNTVGICIVPILHIQITMISYYTIIMFLTCHFIFDFFLQSDRMAKGKSKNYPDLIAHVLVYSIGLMLMMVLSGNALPDVTSKVGFVVINAIAHFFTDYFSSRATSRLYADNEFHDFFATIGLDQLVHYVTLFGTFIWLTT